MKEILLLIPVILLLHTTAGVSTDEQRYKALKFGQTENDYILFQPDMSPFETGFTACAWIRKLNTETSYPTWFSYAMTGEPYEIQITDMGGRTRIFGDTSTLTSLYTVSTGTWFLNCMGWDAASQTRNVYIDGRLVDSKATPAGRTLRQGGSLLLGNEQQRGPGAGMDDTNIFAGEMFKLNMFSRKLSESEIQEMAQDRCSIIEEQKYDEVRVIKWEDILKKTRTGTVTEIDSGCLSTLTTIVQELRSSLQQSEEKLNTTQEELNATKEKLEQTTEEMNQTLAGLEQTKVELNTTQEELENTSEDMDQTRAELKHVKENPDCSLNSTVTSHWDLLYSDEFFGGVITAQKLEVLRKSMQKLEYFEGTRITDGMIRFFKLYHDGEDHCPN